MFLLSVAVADSMSCQDQDSVQPEPDLFSVAPVIAVTSPLCPPSFPDEDTEVHRGHLVSRLSWLMGCAVLIQTQIDITPKDVGISLKFSGGQKPPYLCLAETLPPLTTNCCSLEPKLEH